MFPEEECGLCNGCDIHVREQGCALSRGTVCTVHHAILKETVLSLSPQEIYERMAEKWIELVDLREGDDVKIINHIPAEDRVTTGIHVMGNTPIGTVCKVESIQESTSNIYLSNGYWWNYFNLEKVEKRKEANVSILSTSIDISHPAIDVTINKDGADIRGQKYSIETLKKICAMSEEVGRLGINSSGHFLIGEYSSSYVLLNRKDINAISEAIKSLEL